MQHILQGKNQFCVLNHERKGRAIISSGGDSKDFGENVILALQIIFWIGDVSGNLNSARRLIPLLALLMET